MEKQIRDVHLYANENSSHYSIVLELFTIGENFNLCVMQPGRNPVPVDELIRCFARCGLDCRLMSEERFHLADYEIP